MSKGLEHYKETIKSMYGIDIDRVKPVLELKPPIWDKQQSFNRKAVVICDENDKKYHLISYKTKVMTIDYNYKEPVVTLFSQAWFSRTTIKHCRAFLGCFMGIIYRNPRYHCLNLTNITKEEIMNINSL